MTDEKYNGWSNYATWRINLEIFDGNDWSEEGKYKDIDDLTDMLKERVEDTITNYGNFPDDNLTVQYARAFISDVNFYEIAESIAKDYPSIIKQFSLQAGHGAINQ